jgi:hypothetical protein
MYFLLGLGFMLDLRFDIFHRCVNDVKLATARACKGLFRRTMLLSAFIFGIDYGPWNSGAFFDEKRAMLGLFFVVNWTLIVPGLDAMPNNLPR